MNAAKDSSPKGVEAFIGLGGAKIRQLERLLERELGTDEIARLRRIRDTPQADRQRGYKKMCEKKLDTTTFRRNSCP
jgi:hypothetical protein